MATLADLHDEVAEVAPGATATQIDDRIYEVFRFFCARTGASQQEISLSVVSGTQEYSLPAPTGYDILGVRGMEDEDGEF